MRIALVDSNPNAKAYPLPLLKIGAWRKSAGDECQIFNDRLPLAGEFDEIWITTTFTFDIPHALGIVREAKNRAGRVLVGGISATLLPERFEREGVEVHRGLLPEAESFSPDYSLLGEKPHYSISHTSRGCIRKCGFCMVTRLEPEFVDRRDWEKDLYPGVTKVLFYDNNWIAKDRERLERDITQLHRLVKSGKITSIDFNQGIDARLMTEDIADMLKGLPIKPVRFAFDNMSEDGYYQKAVEMMAARGFDKFLTYTLFNYKDSPIDFYYRMRESINLTDSLGVAVEIFPMRYQPILKVDSGRDYIGTRWTKKKKSGFRTILSLHSYNGQVAPHSIKEFEYWFGKDAKEFERLLSYPKLRQLMARKKGALRMRRAHANNG